jgi:hypothetical protein
MESWSTEDIRAPLYSRVRRRMVDRRRRGFKVWARRRAALVKEMGREPTVAESELLDVLTDRLIAQDLRRAQLQIEEVVRDEQDARGAISEIRRLMMALGLVPRVNDGARQARLADLDGEPVGLTELMDRRR